MMRRGALARITLGLFLLVLFSCASPPKAQKSLPEGELAVAPFHHPRQEWEILGSGETDTEKEIPGGVLDSLTENLLQELEQRGLSSLKGPNSVVQCQEIVLAEEGASPQNARQYWASVGRCVSADAILIPQLTHWQEREGGPWGVERPASVALRLVWLDTQEQRVMRLYEFKEQQKPLTENLLDIGSFLRRGGQWVSAQELAEEGIRRGLEEMGL